MEKNERLFEQKHGRTASALSEEFGVEKKVPQLCVQCSCTLSEDCKSPVPGCCHDCWQQQERIAEELEHRIPREKSRDQGEKIADLQGQGEQSEVTDKQVQTPPKWSLCTWWQKKQREKGVGKKEALETWNNMSSEEKTAFKATLPIPSPDSDAKSSAPTPQPAADVTSLAAFQRKWREFKLALSNADNSHVYHLANYEESFFMYVDVVALLRLGVFDSAAAAERSLTDFSINRKKVGAVCKWLQNHGNEVPTDCPPDFTAGKAHQGALTLQQKKDLLTHVQVMQKSNCVFTSKDAKKAMWRYLGLIVSFFCYRGDQS